MVKTLDKSPSQFGQLVLLLSKIGTSGNPFWAVLELPWAMAISTTWVWSWVNRCSMVEPEVFMSIVSELITSRLE